MEYSRLVEGTDKPLDLQDDIYVSRAPGRLDVMGGIADYSGSLVLQVTSLSSSLEQFSSLNVKTSLV